MRFGGIGGVGGWEMGSGGYWKGEDGEMGRLRL